MAVILTLSAEAVTHGVTWKDNVLRIPAKAVLKQPLAYSASADSPFTVELGSDAQILLLETLTTDKAVNLSTTLKLDARAKLQLISIATESNVNVQRNVTLAGEQSAYQEHDVFYGTGQQGFGITSDVVNAAPRTKAQVLMHGVLDDSARATVTATMRIPKGAIKSDSKLSQHVLLLSKDAKAETFPYLEIEENDVTAGHAATVRPLDADSLFYLRSRGVSETDARKMMIEGFLLPFLSSLDAQTQEHIMTAIGRKLNHATTQHS